MKFTITHKDSYSRGELLLRTFFGWLYIGIPHMVALAIFGIWGAILAFISFWAILFTGSYPQSFFEYQIKLKKWSLRVSARIMNLADGYPAFGLSGTDDVTSLEVEYPERVSRVSVLVRGIFGLFYIAIPHGFCLYFRLIATAFLATLSWFAVLFTGSYPQSFHEFNVGTLRWQTRVTLYAMNITQEYPPFSGK